MKKLFTAAFTLTLFSSYLVPEEKPVANECRMFRDTEFTFSGSNTDCSTTKATANGITFTGDTEAMKMLQTPEGKEMIDKMLGQVLVECLKGNNHSTSPEEMSETVANQK